MHGNEYQKKAVFTANKDATQFLDIRMDQCCTQGIDMGLALNACFGMAGEVGEFNDIVKKWIFHGKELDKEHLRKELGDICWYIALACEAFGWDLDEVLQTNIDKLSARYHGGTFNKNDANNKADGDV
jgi:NTP pyrophosphatase (non-canonical NTP hydrolase)